MRARCRQITGLLAIIAIVLHTALWGAAAAYPMASGADPFSVICHSSAEADGAADQPQNPVLPPTHACDHCNLCGTAAASNLPAIIAVFKLDPARLLHRLIAPTALPTAGIANRANPARAPPVFA